MLFWFSDVAFITQPAHLDTLTTCHFLIRTRKVNGNEVCHKLSRVVVLRTGMAKLLGEGSEERGGEWSVWVCACVWLWWWWW